MARPMEKKTKIDLLAIQIGSVIGDLNANIKKVQNLLEKVDGTTGTYTSAHYATSGSSTTYIAPKSTTITLTSVYTIPTGAAAGTFKGYSTGYSTTAASPSTTNPTWAPYGLTEHPLRLSR